MANGQRKPLGPGRVTLAIVLGALGVFTAAAGAGMQSWPLGALGAAVLVLGVSLLLTSSLRGADRAWVGGIGYVLEIHEPPQSLTHGRCEMLIQIDAMGHPAASVKIRDPRVPVAKWPSVGSVLPIQVATDDLRRVRVLWDDYVPQPQRARFTEETDVYAGVTADGYGPAGGHEGEAVFDIDTDPDAFIDPLPKRKPSPRARREHAGAPAKDADTGTVTANSPPGERGYTVDASGLIEGDLVVAPANIDAIDFNQAPSGTKPGQPAGPNVVELLVGVPAQAGAPDDETLVVLVSDLDRSIDFYCDLLGFHEVDGGSSHAVLASGGTRIILREAGDQADLHPTRVDLEVEDLDEVHRRLVAQDVVFTATPRMAERGDRRELWTAALLDPDGHSVHLNEWRSRDA